MILYVLIGSALGVVVLVLIHVARQRTHQQRQRRSRRSRLFSASMGTGVDP